MKSIQTTGPVVDESDYRWQVAVRIPSANKRCGGILITKMFVLTAAHCVDRNRESGGPPQAFNLAEVELFHGSNLFAAGTRLTLDPNWEIVLHPGWRNNTLPTITADAAYDAALIKLAQPVAAAVVAPVRATPFLEGNAVVSGWGAFDATGAASQFLRAVRVPVATTDVCRTALSPSDRARLGPWSLCTISKTDEACARDSGGPLVVGTAAKPQTIGIVSWGAQSKCGRPETISDLVGVYTRVSEIASWISGITRDPAATTTDQVGKLFTVEPRIVGGPIDR
ncbi:MAG: serine protease [Sphingomonas sp.]|nr:serine protease [Sphingomonas sp.]